MATVVIAALSEGIAPWGYRLPYHRANGKPITGAARFVLSLEAHRRGFQGRSWASLSEWAMDGFEPDAGKGVDCFLDSKKNSLRVLTPTVLYPSDSVAGFEEPAIVPNYELADRLFDASGCRLVRNYIVAQWVRKGANDWIEMPYREDMIRGLDGYFSLLFHELTHWVVLGRRLGEEFDRMPEHQSEFLTNLSAAIVCDRCHIPFLLPVNDWSIDQIKGLQSSDYLFTAVDVAERAADYILKWE